MSTLINDIKFGIRMLMKNPGFTFMVVLVLAIGIGSTTMMLSVVDAVMLRSSPYEDADRLVCVYETKKPERANRLFTSKAGFCDWRQQNHVFEAIVGANQWNGIVRLSDRAEQARGFFVSEGFFSVLGAGATLGRTFTPEEHTAGGSPVVVLSYDHWQNWFGGDPSVIGKPITLSDQVYTVIGVLSKEFRWGFQGIACGLWMPLSLENVEDSKRDYRGMQVIGRLKDDVSHAQAQAEMDLIGERLAQAYPEKLGDYGIEVVPMNEDYARHAIGSGKPQTLLILLGVVVAVLLIACVHVANLLIARSAQREPEMAIRAALGAGRMRIIRQLFIECFLLATCSALLGLLLAYVGIKVLTVLRNQSIPWYVGAGNFGAIPWFVRVGIDVRVLLYVLGLSVLTCILFGTLPAIGATRINMSQRLSKTSVRTTNAGFQKIRSGLVIADIALAFVLLTGAGLLVNSYIRIGRIDHRFNPGNVLTAHVAFDWMRAPEPAERLAAFQEALRRTEALPGVQAVTAANYSPVSGSYSTPAFQIEGHQAGETGVGLPLTEVFPGYFTLLEIPLLQGRTFTEHDNNASTPVVIVNEALARHFWPNETAIGKHLTSVARGNSKPTVCQIVGIVGNIWHNHYAPDEPEIYRPYLQGDYSSEIHLMARTLSDPAVLAATVRKELIATVDGAVIDGVMPMETDIAGLFVSERSNAWLLSTFAAVALLLAGLGIYGTMAYTVSRRTREIGIRLALGAVETNVLATILGRGLKLTLAGLLIGLVGSIAVTRIIRSLLYNVSPTDPLTFTCVSLLLGSAALLAAYIPARRAARINPMEALRYE